MSEAFISGATAPPPDRVATAKVIPEVDNDDGVSTITPTHIKPLLEAY